MITTVYTHSSALKHDTGFSHPERMERIEAVLEVLNTPPFDALRQGAITPATEDRLLLAHRYDYIERLREAIPVKGHAQVDADTVLSPATWDAAMYAAGAVCSAVDDIMAGKTSRAFSAMRPPGHHAEPAHSMGFCLFNNIFIGARHAQEKHGVKKIAIVDFDVHHGNGTDAMARHHDGSILFISTHQYPLWPMTGIEDDNEEAVLNFTLLPESGSEKFRSLYETKVFPEIERFKPDLLMISAGFDAHRLDPLAQLNLEDEDFGWITEKLCGIANRHCDGKIVSVLEGGYNLDALKGSVAAHLKALMGA